MMQAASDALLGWVAVDSAVDGRKRDFYVRQLWDEKGPVDVGLLKPGGLARYGSMCGWTLARAHARSGDRIALAAYLGSGTTFDEAIADFSEAYADQNERDYKAMVGAVKDGRIEAKTGGLVRAPLVAHAPGLVKLTGKGRAPRSESRCGWSRCRPSPPSARPGGSAGSSWASTGASRP